MSAVVPGRTAPAITQFRSPSVATRAMTESRNSPRSIGSAAQEVPVLGVGEHEQIVDIAVHPVELVVDQRGGLGALVRIVAGELEVPPYDRDRRAQLVGDVVEELALANEPRWSRSSIAL